MTRQKDSKKRTSKASNFNMKRDGRSRETLLNGAREISQKARKSMTGVSQTVMSKIDHNGDGIVDSTDIILIALKVPGVRIDREAFLRKELFKNHPQEIIDQAIKTTPRKAGISPEEIDKIADEVIKFERNAVSGISTVLGVPGGLAMAATIPTDIAQYYGYMLRAAQKLLYLYGFPEIIDNGVELDSETINTLTVCLGIMFGVANANNAIKAMAKALATGVEKKLLNTALTKGTIYPIVKSIAKWFSVNMTKKVFSGFFKKAIPIVGAAVGGGITFVSFKPCCYRLKEALQDTLLSNPDHKSTDIENQIYESIKDGIIDVEYEDLTE